jgi:hypothetical protein
MPLFHHDPKDALHLAEAPGALPGGRGEVDPAPVVALPAADHQHPKEHHG